MAERDTVSQFRVGIGHDTHRLDAGRKLVIGGVAIDHDRGPVAHSDGDVLLHAVTDALLGALGWGDIGEWFPDNDPAHAGADSAKLLQQVMDKVADAGWNVVNIDCIVHAQRPKLLPYKPQIRCRLSELLRVPEDVIGVKAKTGERVGPVGREEAMSAEVVVLLRRAV